MKIVYCILDSSSRGGTERTLSIKANYFAEHGHDIHIITTETPCNEQNSYKFSDLIKFHNLQICYREVDNSISPYKIIKKIRKNYIHKKRLSKLLYLIKPDIVVTLFGHELSFLYKIKDGSKKISEFHFSRYYRNIEYHYNSSSILKKWFTLFKEWRKRVLINRYDAFIVLTQEDAKVWRGIKNLYVIPNALSFIPEQISTCMNKKIISVGRLTTQKGFDLLITAWKSVSDKHPDWELYIYGDGKEKTELQNLIKDYSVEKSLHICDPTKNIVDKYLDASIYVMSSRYEGFPMVLIEAMVCGLPCISFACPCGPTEIINNDQDGYIVPINDIKKLSEMICTLIENDEKRQKMGRQARENIMRYSIEHIMKEWEAIFNHLCSKSTVDLIHNK